MPIKILSQDYLKSILRYDLSTGVFTWLVSRGKNKAGAVAKNKCRGYFRIKIDGKGYYAHRLAFLYVLGWMPEQTDHINHNPLDNRWINLRPANNKTNGKNMSRSIRNKSGCTGVRLRDWGKWEVRIHDEGKDISLGCFAVFGDAVAARKAAELKYGYHENHGRRE